MPRMKPLEFHRMSPEEMLTSAESRLARARTRRSVRAFSPDPIPLEVVRLAIDTAAQAPSGAHKQPCTFVLVTDPGTKHRIRVAAEAEERAFYEQRAPEEWLEDLEPFGTDANKPFLEVAPALVVVFMQTQGTDGSKHYYVKESVGLASGMLLNALHMAGLATLTHTPSPMKFLGELLGRPGTERPFLLIPVGYPADDCEVPDIERKSRDVYLVEV